MIESMFNLSVSAILLLLLLLLLERSSVLDITRQTTPRGRRGR